MQMQLVLPNNYVELEQEEMMYLDGGEPMSLSALVGLVTLLGGASYTSGQIVGERVYYSGYSNNQYQNEKWGWRWTVTIAFGLMGAIFMLGFENKFYSLVTGK